MKNIYLFIIVALASCTPIKKLYVLYGENEKVITSKDETIRLFIDRTGLIYPDALIKDNVLRDPYNIFGLESYYHQKPEFLNSLLKESNLNIDSINHLEKVKHLQNSLIKKYVDQINKRNDITNVTFLVHGYNNEFSWSQPRNSRLTSDIRTQSKKNHLFIEVYWDGLSKWQNKEESKKFDNLKIWDNAQASSYNVGIELRRIVSQLNCQDLVLIGHSTGANVVSACLFNETSKVQKPKKRDRFNETYLNKLVDTVNYKTPEQKEVSVFLIAPAMPGVNTFRDYYSRTSRIEKEDNYKLFITHNSNDKALNKYSQKIFRGDNGRNILRKNFGATTLGSSKKEKTEVEKYFIANYPSSFMKFIDFSINNEGYNNYIHGIDDYRKHKNFLPTINEIYN